MTSMPVSSATRDLCRPFLPPGEEIRYVFPGTAVPPFSGMFNVIVAITATRVTVLACSWFSRDRPGSVWARYPRAIELGPLEYSPGPVVNIGNLALEIDEEYVAVIRAADAELSRDGFMPPDPLPDL